MNSRQCTLSLGATFLMTGFGFAFPLLLFPDWLANVYPERAPETLNLFCFVAWLGLAHFYFAYRGHFLALRKQRDLSYYLLVFVLSLALLLGLRATIGLAIFSALAWVYFISHLIKAEMYFAGQSDWRVFLPPLLAFAYFSYVLLVPEGWLPEWSLFGGAVLCMAPMLSPGFRSGLTSLRSDPILLVSAFLIGETLLWGRYRPWMTPEFRDGVYTVHVALASFYHYMRSYFYMTEKSQGGWRKIIIVNLATTALGVATIRLAHTTPLVFLFGPHFFTVWVWLHQSMSDVFNFRKRKFAPARA